MLKNGKEYKPIKIFKTFNNVRAKWKEDTAIRNAPSQIQQQII